MKAPPGPNTRILRPYGRGSIRLPTSYGPHGFTAPDPGVDKCPVTVMAWVVPEATQWSCIWNRFKDAEHHQYLGANNSGEWYWKPGGHESDRLCESSVGFQHGKWTHVCGSSLQTGDVAGNSGLYVNGSEVVAQSRVDSGTSSDDVTIGVSTPWSEQWPGRIAAFKWWAARLTEAEIKAEMQSWEPMVHLEDLVAWLPMVNDHRLRRNWDMAGEFEWTEHGTIYDDVQPPIQGPTYPIPTPRKPERTTVRHRAPAVNDGLKPAAWPVDPGMVSPEWRGLWRGLQAVVPAWGNRMWTPGGWVAPTSENDVAWEPTPLGLSIFCPGIDSYDGISWGGIPSGTFTDELTLITVFGYSGAASNNVAGMGCLAADPTGLDDAAAIALLSGTQWRFRVHTSAGDDRVSPYVDVGTDRTPHVFVGRWRSGDFISLDIYDMAGHRVGGGSGGTDGTDCSDFVGMSLGWSTDTTRALGGDGHVEYAWNRALTDQEVAQFLQDPFGPIRPARPAHVQQRSHIYTLGKPWGEEAWEDEGEATRIQAPAIVDGVKPEPWPVEAGMVSPEWRGLWRGLVHAADYRGTGATDQRDLITGATSQVRWDSGTGVSVTPVGRGVDPSLVAGGSLYWDVSALDIDFEEPWSAIIYHYRDGDSPGTGFLDDSYAEVVKIRTWVSGWQLTYNEGNQTQYGEADDTPPELILWEVGYDGTDLWMRYNNLWTASITPSDGGTDLGTITKMSLGNNVTTLFTGLWNRNLTEGELALLAQDPFGPIRPAKRTYLRRHRPQYSRILAPAPNDGMKPEPW